MNIPQVIDCHCLEPADKYRQRKFINKLDYEVIRVFYRCRNCWSRIHVDYIEQADKANNLNVAEWHQNKRENINDFNKLIE